MVKNRDKLKQNVRGESFQKNEDSRPFCQQLDNSYNPISEEETNRLIDLVKSGDENAKEALVKHNFRLLLKIASSHIVKGVLTNEDLVTFGYFGLEKACRCETYDRSKNKKFSSYLSTAINNSINDAKREFSSYNIDNKSDYYHIIKIEKTRKSLQQELGREPSIKELASRCELDEDKVENLLNIESTSNPCSLEDFMASEEAFVHSEQGETKPLKFNYKIFDKLNENQRKVIELRFGFKDRDKEYTRKEIGIMMGISHQRVEQIERRALDILRKEVEK